MQARAADVKPDEACCNNNRKDNPVYTIGKHRNPVFRMDLRVPNREWFFALCHLQKGGGEKQCDRPVQNASCGTEDAKFLKPRQRNQDETCEQGGKRKTGYCGRRANAEQRALNAKLRTQVLFAFQEVSVQNVVDNLQRLPRKHNRKQKRKQVDAPVEQVRTRHRRDNRRCNRQCRNKNQLWLPKEVENQKQNNQPRRDVAHHLRFGQKSLAGLDRFVDFARVMHLEIAGRFFVFQLLGNFIEQVTVRLQIRDGMRRVNLDNADGPGFVGMAHGELVKVLLFEVAQKLFALFRSRLRDGINRALEVDEQRVVLHDVVVLELLDAMHHDINIVFTGVQEFVLFVIIDVGLEVCKMDRRTRLHLLCEVFGDAIVRARIRRLQNDDEAPEPTKFVFNLLDVARFTRTRNRVLQLQIPAQVHDGVNAQDAYRKEHRKDNLRVSR